MTSPLNSIRLSRRALVASAALASSVSSRAIAQEATPVASPETGGPSPSDWPLYGANLDGTRDAADPVITTANVADLKHVWTVDAGGAVNGTPIIVGGTVYVGSYTGTLLALELATGRTIWTYSTGAAVLEPNLNVNLGILGSAAVSGDTVYVGDATATLHAIDATTGALRWKTKTDDQTAACIWSSPVVANGTVYVGVASVAKEAGFRGNVVALDTATDGHKWKTYSVPEGADGGGVFAVPVIDLEHNLLFVGTQNAYTSKPAPYGNPTSILALDLDTGAERWVFNAPPGGGPDAPIDDVGFSASPNLFTARVFGRRQDLLGVGQKSGDYWALDRTTGEYIWRTQVSPAGPLGGMEGTSAVSGTRIAVPATDWSDPAGPAAAGLVSVLDTGTGRILWTAMQSAPAPAPVSISDDVVLHAGIDGTLHAYALQTGQELLNLDLGASASSGIAIAQGFVVLAAATPPFAPFVRPGTSIIAFSLNGATPGTEATPSGDGTWPPTK